MNRYSFIIILTISLVCCINIKTHANDTFDVEIANDVYYMSADGVVYIEANANQDVSEWIWDAFDLDSYEYDYTRSSTLETWTYSGYPGEYEVSVFAQSADQNDWDSCRVYVFDAEISGEEQYIGYGTAMDFDYEIEPYSGWYPDNVSFWIEDEGGSPVYDESGWGAVTGSGIVNWDGRDNYGFWLEPGVYYACLRVDIGYTFYTGWYEFTVLRPEIEVSISEPVTNNVRSGLDLGTLRFELNGTVIQTSNLSIDSSYTGDLLTCLDIQYIPLSAELVSGTNTVKVDIDDNVDNHMDQLVETFYLP